MVSRTFPRPTSYRKFGFDGPNWCFYFWFVGWTCISFGAHVCFDGPHFELHIPFGFIRFGRKRRRARRLNMMMIRGYERPLPEEFGKWVS